MDIEASAEPKPQVSVGIIVLVGLLLGATLAWAWTAQTHWPWTTSSASLASDDHQSSKLDWSRVGWDTTAPWQRDVVRISTERCGDEIRGTGVIVDGVVFTNRHVLDGARSVEVTTSDGVAHRARALTVSGHVDLAEIVVDDLDGGLQLGSLQLEAGQGSSASILRIAGFPGGAEFATHRVGRDGILHGVGYPDPDVAIHLDANVVPGESGSPIIDDEGKVVALLYARSTADGNGLAIDGAQVRDEAKRLVAQPFAVC